jgi:hypothetical protein
MKYNRIYDEWWFDEEDQDDPERESGIIEKDVEITGKWYEDGEISPKVLELRQIIGTEFVWNGSWFEWPDAEMDMHTGHYRMESIHVDWTKEEEEQYFKG